jgi:signal transduction histidine kinase
VNLLALVAEIATGAASGYVGTGFGDPISASRSFAKVGGAEDILIFCYDHEVRAFLPAPPFAQTLPNSLAWQRFVLSIDEDGATAELPSPYRGKEICTVEARRVDSQTVIALLGKKSARPSGAKANDEFWLAARLLGRLFSAAHELRVANARAKLAAESARSSSEIASSLLATRKKLEGSLAETRLERQKLRETNQRLQLAQQIASLGTWEWNPQDRSIFLSAELCRMCGIADDAIPRTVRDALLILEPAERATFRAAVRQAIRSGAPAELEVRLRRNGLDRWIASRMAVGADAEGHRRLTGVCLDMTRRRKSEEALRRSERLASTGRLAATIAHEINNPLESVLNLLYILGLDETLSPRSRECVTLADREIARVSHIARQTLAFYRDTTAPVEIDVESLLREILDLYEPKLRPVAVSVESCIPPEFRFRGYRGELKQLFSNLIANAIDAMQGSPNGSPPELHLDIAAADGQLRVALRDTGAGIPPEHIASLFQPFFTTKSHTGTGLGLWVSDGIARKHGGRIEVQSSTDPARHGTTMTVFLAGTGA